MYEFHASFSASLETDSSDSVQTMIDDLDAPGFLVNSGYSNGQYIATLAGCSNHDRNSHRLLALFRKVGDLCPTSWGIVHIFDDEDAIAPVKAYRLSRGTLSELDASDYPGFQLQEPAE